jgi:hypothetical protein
MNSRIAETAVGRAILAAARAGTVGAPVYLRYAFEAAAPAGLDGLLWHAADAVAFAAAVLGEPASLYASAVRDGSGQPIHLAVAVRHPNASVALLGIGAAGGARRPPTLLFLGDRGAIEGNPVATGTILHDGTPGGATTPLRDDGTGAYPAWLDGRPPDATSAADAQCTMVMAVIRRSIESGRSQALGQDGGRRDG